MHEIDKEQEGATRQVLDVLEEWGSESRFIWFRELHRITDVDKGILRNIINELKKSKQVKGIHGTNNRIFFCLRKYYIKCRDVEFRCKGRETMLKDNKTRIIQGKTKSTERTRKRSVKQQNRRRVKSFTKAKNKRPHRS